MVNNNIMIYDQEVADILTLRLDPPIAWSHVTALHQKFTSGTLPFLLRLFF